MPTNVEQHGTVPSRRGQVFSAFGNVYQLAGRRFDAGSGLYYLRNRYYDPRSGRFVSGDPLHSVDGPNPYQYARNIPVNAADPSGLSVNCIGLAGNAVVGSGGGGGFFACFDECGNSAVIFSASLRLGVDLGAGPQVTEYGGGLEAYLNTVVTDVTSGLGFFTGGLDFDEQGRLRGGHVAIELSPLPLSGSVGESYAWVLYKNTTFGYPCGRPARPIPEPVDFAETHPTWDMGPVWRPGSTALPLACCCIKWECTGDVGSGWRVATAILGVPAGTKGRQCDARCQEKGYRIGYGAQNNGASQQCLPGTAARAIDLYRRGMPHHNP